MVGGQGVDMDVSVGAVAVVGCSVSRRGGSGSGWTVNFAFTRLVRSNSLFALVWRDCVFFMSFVHVLHLYISSPCMCFPLYLIIV